MARARISGAGQQVQAAIQQRLRALGLAEVGRADGYEYPVAAERSRGFGVGALLEAGQGGVPVASPELPESDEGVGI